MAENSLPPGHDAVTEQLSRVQPFDVDRHTTGLPTWLVSKLEQYRDILQRNWRLGQRAQNIHRFWSGHLRMWRFFCGQSGVKQIDELKKEHVFAFIDARLAAGRAASGINTDLSNLRAFLRFLQEEGWPVNDTLLHLPGLKQPDSLPRALSDEQVRKVRDEIAVRISTSGSLARRQEALMAKAAFNLLWQGGLRLGEVEELRLQDLDLANRLLIVRDGKGLKDRVVYLSEAVMATLQNYLAIREKTGSNEVFLYRNAPLKKDLLRRRLKSAGEQVGAKVKIHGLRHTCATQLLNAGCPITSIQAIMGHKKLDTTMIYARVHDRTVEQDYFRAVEKLSVL